MGEFAETRSALLARPGKPNAERRAELAELTDTWIRRLCVEAHLDQINASLVAVGGYGRGELAPGSDLDLLLLVDASVPTEDVTRIADALWYPIWDQGMKLDHSVRTISEARRMASADLKVVLGLLDARTVFGNDTLTSNLRSAVLADWRAQGPKRLEELHWFVKERTGRAGELAHVLEPDLKESFGGLRDLTILRAVSATWITDIDHTVLVGPNRFLLDVRDALHTVTGRATDKLVLQEQAAVATLMEFDSADDLLRAVLRAGRSIAYASDLAWHRVDRLMKPATKKTILRRGSRTVTQDRQPLAEGVVVQNGEVVLAKDADPRTDPNLLLRAAAAAAQAGLRLAPHTVERLANESAPLPVPWPRESRDALVSLLGAGSSTLPVWEALDQLDVISQLVPQWAVVRSAPQHNPVHTYTVDRHLLETAINAAAMTRRVSRPDLLLIAALFHDIGKAREGDHSTIGASLMETIAPNLGFDWVDTAILVRLVKEHLLLPDTATRRDLDDPATISLVADRVADHGFLDLLESLTEADAQATGPAVTSEWRFALIADLVQRVHGVLRGDDAPVQPDLSDVISAFPRDKDVHVGVLTEAGLTHVTVVAPDRVGLLSLTAGVLALHKLNVRSASTQTLEDRAISEWIVTPQFGLAPQPQQIEKDLGLALAGALDVDERLARRARDAVKPDVVVPEPAVHVLDDASDRATVLEIRAHDVPGLLNNIAGAISLAGLDITAAKVATLGADAIDVFYVIEKDTGEKLSEARVQDAVSAILNRLKVQPES